MKKIKIRKKLTINETFYKWDLFTTKDTSHQIFLNQLPLRHIN